MSYMDYVNRDKIAITSDQVLTSGDWDFEIHYPSGSVMYKPPEGIVQVRAKGIQGVNPLPTVQIMTIELRGFTIIQPGKVQTKPDPVTLDLQDFEDQAIVAWIWDWNMKMCNLKTLQSYRRQNLFCDILIWQLASNRRQVFEYHYYNCLPEGSQFNVQLDSEKNPLGAGTVTFNAEYMIPRPMNVNGVGD